MTLQDLLVKARNAVAGGWSGPAGEPFCRDRQGRISFHDAEGVHLFSVEGALACYCHQEPELFDQAVDLLESLADPAYAAVQLALVRYSRTHLSADGAAALETIRMMGVRESLGLASWLEKQGRTVEEVVKLFDRAIAKVRTGGHAAPLSWRAA